MGVGRKRAEAELGYHFAFALRGTGGMREKSRVRYQHCNSQIVKIVTAQARSRKRKKSIDDDGCAQLLGYYCTLML